MQSVDNNNSSFPVRHAVGLSAEDLRLHVDRVIEAAEEIRAFADRAGVRFFYVAFDGESPLKVRRYTKEGLAQAMDKRCPTSRKAH